MKLQLLQLQVQRDGTIDKFNYAYCKLLYKKAMKLLKTDFIDGHGNVFPINKKAIAECEKRLETRRGIRNIPYAQMNKDEQFIDRAADITIKDNSLLPIIVNQIEIIIFVDRFSIPERSIEARDIQKILDCFDKVKRFLEIFE